MHWSRFYLQTKISHQILMFLSGECANVSYILCIIDWVSRFFVVYIQTSSFVFINSSLASFKISQENHFWNFNTKVHSTPNILLHFKPALTARNYIWKEYFFASWKITCAQATFLFLVYLWRTKWNERKRKQRRILNEPQNSRQLLRTSFIQISRVCRFFAVIVWVMSCIHSLCLPFLTSHANLQFFGPR